MRAPVAISFSNKPDLLTIVLFYAHFEAFVLFKIIFFLMGASGNKQYSINVFSVGLKFQCFKDVILSKNFYIFWHLLTSLQNIDKYSGMFGVCRNYRSEHLLSKVWQKCILVKLSFYVQLVIQLNRETLPRANEPKTWTCSKGYPLSWFETVKYVESIETTKSLLIWQENG